jgi:hypothetical protein
MCIKKKICALVTNILNINIKNSSIVKKQINQQTKKKHIGGKK